MRSAAAILTTLTCFAGWLVSAPVRGQEPVPQPTVAQPLVENAAPDGQAPRGCAPALEAGFRDAEIDDLTVCVECLQGLSLDQCLPEARGQAEIAAAAASPSEERLLAKAESALRRKGERIVETLAKYEQLLFAPEATQQEKEDALTKIEEFSDQVEEIREVLPTFRSESLFENFDDYDDYFFRLNTGYEFADIDQILDDSFPLLVMLVNLKMGGHDVVEATHGLGLYGTRIGFAARLTNSAEQELTIPADDGDPSEDDEPVPDPVPDDGAGEEKQQAIEFELHSFVPLHRTLPLKPGNWRNYIGPLLTFGGRKTDEEDHVELRYYGGIRFAMNPELYWDLLFGRTDSLRSDRLELRGQLPVRLFANGSRLYLGAIGNIGLGDERKAILGANGDVVRAAEEDVVRVYLSWNGDVLELFGGKGKE